MPRSEFGTLETWFSRAQREAISRDIFVVVEDLSRKRMCHPPHSAGVNSLTPWMSLPPRFARRQAIEAVEHTIEVPLVGEADVERDVDQRHVRARQALKTHEALCRDGGCPPLLELRGRSHISEIQAVHTTDHALSDAVATFIATLR